MILRVQLWYSMVWGITKSFHSPPTHPEESIGAAIPVQVQARGGRETMFGLFQICQNIVSKLTWLSVYFCSQVGLYVCSPCKYYLDLITII